MGWTPQKIWNTNEILTAADLNNEFQNIYDSGVSATDPLTASFDLDGYELILDSNGDTSITADSDDIIHFRAAGQDLFVVDGDVGSAVNGIAVVATATGTDPAITSYGADTDMGIRFQNEQAENILILAAVATGVNEITVTNAATGTNPTIAATASDSDTDIGIDFENDQAEEMLVLSSVATGINHLTISNAASGSNPTIACTGDEDDTGITLQNQAGEEILILDSVDASVNEVTITSATTGNDATIVGTGEADAGLTIQASGSGTVKIGDATLVFPDVDGNAGDSVITDGSATLSVGKAALPRSYLAGLQMTRTDANTITIAVGECRNTGNTVNMVRSATLAKDIDTTWAAGAGGGLNATDFASGSSDCEADTWYHVFIIEDGSGTVDAGFDKDIDATNLLSDSGYTNYRRIGSVRTDASKDILDFTQSGDTFLWAAVVDEGVTAADTTARTASLTVPSGTGLRVMAWFNAGVDAASSDEVTSFYPPDGDNTTPTLINGRASVATNNASSNHGAGQFWILTDTSGQIGYRSSQATTSTDIGTIGWLDRRGKDD